MGRGCSIHCYNSIMSNQFEIPRDVEERLRARHRVCAYCRGEIKAYLGVMGNRGDKATIEHLNRKGPFHWADGLKENELVICCGRCNSSRGTKKLADWFESPYCQAHGISAATVAPEVKEYLRLPVSLE